VASKAGLSGWDDACVKGRGRAETSRFSRPQAAIELIPSTSSGDVDGGGRRAFRISKNSAVNWKPMRLALSGTPPTSRPKS